MVYSEEFKKDKIDEWTRIYLDAGYNHERAKRLATKRYKVIYGKTEFHVPEVPDFMYIGD